jgi:CheY-like chemotaxis protein
MRQAGTKVLVVDDDPEWADLLKDLLESEGYVVSSADNGLAALEQLPRFKPFIVITDLQMPVLDGRQLLSGVHSYDERVPVIIVTADRERVSPGLPGAFRVIGKLSTLEGVLSAVADATAHRVARAPLRKLWQTVRLRSRAGRPADAPIRNDRSFGNLVRRGCGGVSSALSRISSSPLRHPILLTAVVVSAAVVLLQLTPRLTA